MGDFYRNFVVFMIIGDEFLYVYGEENDSKFGIFNHYSSNSTMVIFIKI